MTIRLMMAIKPMKMSARFHARSKLLQAPAKTMMMQTMRKMTRATLFLVMNRKLDSA